MGGPGVLSIGRAGFTRAAHFFVNDGTGNDLVPVPIMVFSNNPASTVSNETSFLSSKLTNRGAVFDIFQRSTAALECIRCITIR